MVRNKLPAPSSRCAFWDFLSYRKNDFLPVFIFFPGRVGRFARSKPKDIAMLQSGKITLNFHREVAVVMISNAFNIWRAGRALISAFTAYFHSFQTPLDNTNFTVGLYVCFPVCRKMFCVRPFVLLFMCLCL